MPIIDQRRAPEVPWRPGYRKWDVAGHQQVVTGTLSINTAEAGTGAPMHTHTIDELIVTIDGMLEVNINGETHVLARDHTLVIPPGAEHGFKLIGEGNGELLAFFPTLDPYSAELTDYLEGARPASVQD